MARLAKIAQAKEQDKWVISRGGAQLLHGFWQRIGERPETHGLDDAARAEVLLRSGTLTGWIGSAQQIPGAQETAKDLISESAGLFEKLGLDDRVAEARIDLGICYWREGALDEARVTLQEVLDAAGRSRNRATLASTFECRGCRKGFGPLSGCVQIHQSQRRCFETSSNHAV